MEAQKLERIEKYLAQQMSKSEQSAFETELSTDPELEEAFGTYQIGNAMISSRSRYLLKQELLAQGKQLRHKGIKQLQIRRNLAIAASIGIIVVLTTVFLLNRNKQSDLVKPTGPIANARMDKFYSDNSMNYPPEEASLSPTEETEKLFSQANKLLNKQQYDSTLLILAQLKSIDSMAFFPKTILLEGYSLLQKGDTNGALDAFNKIPPDNPDARRTADWFEALTYLRMHQDQAAIDALWKIANDKNAYFQAQAQKIIKTLNQIEK